MKGPLEITDEIAEDILNEFKNIGEEVALLLREQQGGLSSLKVSYKGGESGRGAVSDADYIAENLILRRLFEKYPQIPILSEEMAYKESISDYQSFQKMPLCFAIDPLDGSNNFIHGLDHYCVSLALLKYGKSHIGFIIRPSTKESFAAREREGAWYQSSIEDPPKRLFIKTKDIPLKNCFLGAGRSLYNLGLGDGNKERRRSLYSDIHGIRQMGAAALDLCYVALERFDGYCAQGLSPWDVAAGAVILQEANIILSDFHGKETDCFSRTFLAAPDGIHQKLQKILLSEQF